MNATERGIFEQFDYWAKAPQPAPLDDASAIHVFVGCGTSYYIAQALSAAVNARVVASPAIRARCGAPRACHRAVAQR
jgi:glucosamine--fructose-6-phosphate aminotransferase (isomerizing)